jgi:S-DNA-T family DNA segregation ATPase FtsK/SpoIIIE
MDLCSIVFFHAVTILRNFDILRKNTLLNSPSLVYSRTLFRILKEMIVDGIGLCFLIFSIGGIIALMSYHPMDPCGNVAIDGPIQNWMGSWGAFGADILFQWFGIGAFVFPFLFFLLFIAIIQRKSIYHLILMAFLVALVGGLIQPSSLTVYPNALAVLIFRTLPPWVFRCMLGAIGLGGLLWKLKPWTLKPWRREEALLPQKEIRQQPQPVAAEKPVKMNVVLPSLELLKEHASQKSDRRKELHIDQLQGVLNDFGVKGEVLRANPGPIVTLYELEPAAGVKSSRIIALADDIARSMSALSARVAVIPGKNLVGIELSNIHREMVFLKELIASSEYVECQGQLALVLGKDISGKPVIADLSKMPHLLVAGTTGSGKSVGINSMILSLLYRLSPEQCKLIMIDPKMLELSVYDGIPHLLAPVITDPKKAIMTLKWVVQEMENRYRLMSQLGVRHILGYNTRVTEARIQEEPIVRHVQVGFDEHQRPIWENQVLQLDALPFIVIVVDEMADLMLVAGKELEIVVQRLAQMARAAGIHLIMATQRPSVDVITGTIKANFPTRISFQVTSKIDSRTIFNEQGAEHLLGQGDMLYMASGGRLTRVHGPFVSDQEIENVVTFLKSLGEPSYIDMTVREEELSMDDSEEGSGEDYELYQKALEIVRRDGKISTSYLQRQLQLGYNRAARLVEKMEKEGVVSPPNHAGKREIL